MLLSLGTVPAWALSEPAASTKDQHVRTVAYDPQNRVQLIIQEGGATNITFDSMEFIQHTVKADTAPFGYPKLEKEGEGPVTNNLPLVGLKPGVGTLVVITRHAPPDDKERAYNFSIKVVPAPSDGDDPNVTYQLTFTYGPEIRPVAPRETTAMMVSSAVTATPRQLTWKERKAQKDAEALREKLRADVTYGPKNIQYWAQGRNNGLAPVVAFDNGQLTAFRYPGNMAQPAVFRVVDNRLGQPAVCSGERATTAELEAPEQQENTTTRDDMLVVQETAPHWRLRSGESVIDVWNCGYNPIGYNPGTGTNTPEVVRRVILP